MRAAALVLVLLGGLLRPAVADEVPLRWTLILSSGLNGALAPASCDPARRNGRHLGHLASSVKAAKVAAEADGRTVVAAVQLGDFAGPGAVGRFLLRESHGAERLADLAARLGFTHAVLGNNFLDRPYDEQAALALALPQAGVKLLNATISCTKRPGCAALADLPKTVTIDAAGTKVALVGATGDAILTTLDSAQKQGLSVAPLEATLAAEAKAARAAGAAVVLAAVHVPSGNAGTASVVQASRELSDVDLLLANVLGDAPEAAATLAGSGGAAVAASGETPTWVVRVDVDLEKQGGKYAVTRLAAERVRAEEPDPSFTEEMSTLVGDYCAELDLPLAAHALKPVDEKQFLAFLLDEMRRSGDAEVAVANETLLDPAAFPLDRDVSTADLFAAIPYEDALATASLTGGALKSLWNAGKAARHPLAWAGVTEKDGSLLVNERPLDESSRYQVAMPDFLARGGDQLVGDSLEFQLERRGGRLFTLRDVALAALSEPREGTLALMGQRPVELASRLRWTWNAGLTITGAETHRENQAHYTDPRLVRADASSIRGEFTGRADADARDQTIRISTRLRYARAAVEPTPAAETEDQIYGEALYRLRYFKRVAKDPQWAPVPYAAATLDSEFVQNPGEPFRHEEVGATLGVRLLPWTPLELKLGVGVRREVLDPTGHMRYGLEAGYELPRFSPWKVRGLPVDVESGVDYFVYDLTGTPQQEGRMRLRLALPLGGPLAAAVGADVFLFRQGGAQYAVVVDGTVGLTVRFDGARQQF